MKSHMIHQFSRIPQADIPRSSFNRSHCHKTTFDAGYLIPFYIDEALPGDTFNLRHNIFARLATPLVPFMDNCFLDVFYFAVPNRLVWENWQKFNGEQEKPGDSTDYLVPTITCPAGGFEVGSLSDYFGLPTGISNLTGISSLWHRAYNLIWNEWFRDQNLQEPVPVPTGDGPDNPDDFVLLRRGKRHDYFTSCLPWPQKGPGVEISMGASANIAVKDGSTAIPNTYSSYLQSPGSYPGSYGVKNLCVVQSDSKAYFDGVPGMSGSVSLNIPISTNVQAQLANNLYADLSTAAAVTINSMRQAFQVQKLMERDARGGTRYTEIIRAHFGVISPDGRLQRPEYLGGCSARVHINPVQQTSSSDSTSPQGHLAAFGVVADSRNGFTKSFTEHCLIIGLVNVRADLTYQQGVPRMFSRSTRYDFYWPALAHLGEQAVLNKEIYAQGSHVVDELGQSIDEKVFGYQERWAEYRYFPSKITGKFRSTYAQTLDCWHLSQKFTSLPKLNASFIEDNPPFARVVAVPSEPHFLFDSFIELTCARPMPVYSVPGMADHF